MENSEDKQFFESPPKSATTSIRHVKLIDLIPQFVASSLMYLPVIQAGINMSFASVLISQLADKIDTNQASIIGSIWAISLPVGAFSSGYISDRIGRKKIGIFVCIPFFMAWCLTAISSNLTTIYIARIVAGICCGITTASVVYTAEISYKTFRSALLCMNSVWVSFGIFSTYLLNYLHFNMHFIAWIYAAVSLLSMLLIFFVPESSHWILFFNHHVREEEKFAQLRKTLAWLYRNPELAASQYDELVSNYQSKKQDQMHQQDEQQKFSWRGSIREPQVYKPLLILTILFLLQQLSGGYVLIFYTLNIFRNLGSDFASQVNENLASLLLGSIRLFMAIIAAILSQKCNRKTLLYTSTIGMSLFAFISAFKMMSIDGSGHALFLKHASNQSEIIPQIENSSSFGNYFLLICILCYILFASIGLLIIPWTCIAELYPIKYKAKYGGVTVAIAYIFMSIVLRIFPFMLDSMTISMIFLIFGISSMACGIFIHFYLPETHRRTFIEIENFFLGKK